MILISLITSVTMSLDIITDQMGAELLIENKGLGRFWKGPCFSKEYQPELQKKYLFYRVD